MTKDTSIIEAAFRYHDIAFGSTTVVPVFWRANDYATYGEAEKAGATYEGEAVIGLHELRKVMANVGRALDCVAHGAGDDIRARVVIHGMRWDNIKNRPVSTGISYDLDRNCYVTPSYASDHVRELVARAEKHGYASVSDEVRATYGTGSYLEQLSSGYWYIACSL